MSVFYITLIILFVTSCQSNANNKKNSKNDEVLQSDDSLKQQSSVINQYYLKEKSARDSINKYQLDSIYNRCLELLYGIYGKEKIADLTKKKSTTIGECDIRLYRFQYKSPHLRRIDFEIFWNDSLPVNAEFNFGSIGKMITSFTVDIGKKKIINGSVGDVMFMPISSIGMLYTDIIKQKSFSDYLKENEKRVHIKFKKYFLPLF